MKNIRILKNQINKLIILSLISFNLFAQEEVPVVYYEFNSSGGDILKATNGPDALAYESIESGEDRDGTYGKAFNFTAQNGRIQLPNLSSYLPDLTNISSSNKEVSDFGYTISFWVQLFPNQVLSAPGNSELPYLPSDITNQFFYVMDDRVIASEECDIGVHGEINCLDVRQPGFGLSVIRDRVVINRVMKDTNPVIPWKLWLWDPVAITTSDWYHIVMVVKYNKTVTYLFDKNGNSFCRLNYFRAPDLRFTSSWGIGSPGGRVEVPKSIDDFKIYASAHDSDLVKTNHNLEKPSSWGVASKKSNTESVLNVEENSINIYPNPNSGKFYLDFTLLNEDKVSCSLYSIDGRQVWTNAQNFSSGNHSLQINEKLSMGMYFLTVESNEFTIKGHKIIIK